MKGRKSNRIYLILLVPLVIVLVGLVLIPLIWPGIAQSTIACRRQSRLQELQQARALWQDRSFARYRLTIQVGEGSSGCEKVLNISEQGQTRTVRNSCLEHFMGNHFMELLGSPRSVAGLFDYIEDEIGRLGECGPNGCACDGARTIETMYDSDHGYPKAIETRLRKDWITRGWPPDPDLFCSLVGSILPSPVTAAVEVID